MEFVVVAAIVAVSFGAAATWLLATRLPERWLDKSASEGRYAHLGLQNERSADADPRLDQARIDTRRVRRPTRTALTRERKNTGRRANDASVAPRNRSPRSRPHRPPIAPGGTRRTRSLVRT
ncbi:hypothetical protein M3I53_01445 [Paraburkholderia sp. CNPSo 3272]|uniref:hypothetical protein n=1 Tax=Paraburkholderia sp. CNPSo 3272 TaxID=2940931 RepID=UPI0020B86FB6|nr:hypothetical protein [Paraburkholderia sp. CNPSo 3272]MCP3721799.1 hypothetical protein [Paraburkholderia sp. CNPSo 3272]